MGKGPWKVGPYKGLQMTWNAKGVQIYEDEGILVIPRVGYTFW